MRSKEQYKEEFQEYIKDEIRELYLTGFTSLKEEEIDNFLNKIIEKSDKEKIDRLISINRDLKQLEKEIETIKSIPQHLQELAVVSKKNTPKLEKVLVHKARGLIIKFNQLHENEYIKEFFYRFFEPENIALSEERKVPTNKNFYNLIRKEFAKANKGCKTTTVYDPMLKRNVLKVLQKGQIEKDLGFDFEDIFNMLSTDVIENIYFYEPTKGTKLDTYVFQIIKNGLQKIRNISKFVDGKGGRIGKAKSTVIAKKIKKIKYKLEERNMKIDIDIVWRLIEEENKKIKYVNDKIKRPEFEECYNNMGDKYVSINDLMSDDEGSEHTNDAVFGGIWDETMKNTEYDPEGSYKKNQESLELKSIMTKAISSNSKDKYIAGKNNEEILKSEAEKLILEYLLENIIDDKKLKIKEEDFNTYYNNKLGFAPLEQEQINKLLIIVIKKIRKNKNVFIEEVGISL